MAAQPHSADHSLRPGRVGERTEIVKVRKRGKVNAMHASKLTQEIHSPTSHGLAGVQVSRKTGLHHP